jgi:prenyltransferase beta subunit
MAQLALQSNYVLRVPDGLSLWAALLLTPAGLVGHSASSTTYSHILKLPSLHGGLSLTNSTNVLSAYCFVAAAAIALLIMLARISRAQGPASKP